MPRGREFERRRPHLPRDGGPGLYASRGEPSRSPPPRKGLPKFLFPHLGQSVFGGQPVRTVSVPVSGRPVPDFSGFDGVGGTKVKSAVSLNKRTVG